MPSRLLFSFLPWVVFSLALVGQHHMEGVAIFLGLICHIALNNGSIRRLFWLDVGTLFFFLLYGLYYFVFFPQEQWVAQHIFWVSNVVMVAIMWSSLLFKRPFTLPYAQETVSPEIAASHLFFEINLLLSLLWSIALSIMILLPLFLGVSVPHHPDIITITAVIAVIVITAAISHQLPGHWVARALKKQYNINIKTLYRQGIATSKARMDISFTQAAPGPVTERVDVVIVGAGPVGMTLALLLEQHGVKVVLLEKQASPLLHPKARSVSCRSMEIFRHLGIAHEMRACEIPKEQHWIGWYQQLSLEPLARVLPTGGYETASPEADAAISQQYVEAILLETLKRRQVDVRVQQEVLAVQQTEQAAFVTVHAHNTTQVIEANYVLGADGGHSTVRTCLGIPLYGPAAVNVNCSVYCEMDLDTLFPKDRRAGMSFVLRGNLPPAIVLSVDGDRQWIVLFPTALSSVKILERIYTEAYAIQQIQSLLGDTTIPIWIKDIRIWSLGTQLGQTFQVGRCFLVGDAVHRFSPSGGMGMNTGLQDAHNLAWKLAYVLQDRASALLLESYSIERTPIVLDRLQWSANNLSRIIQIHQIAEREQMELQALQTAVSTQSTHLNHMGLDLGSVYQSLWIASEKDSVTPPMNPAVYHPSAYPGARLPHVWLREESGMTSTLDKIQTAFVLFCMPGVKTIAEGITFGRLTTVILSIGKGADLEELVEGEFAFVCGLNAQGACWVRPDGHVAWRGALNDPARLSELQTLIRVYANGTLE